MNKKRIIIFIMLGILVATMLLVSCTQRACPAYDRTSSGQFSDGKPLIKEGGLYKK